MSGRLGRGVVCVAFILLGSFQFAQTLSFANAAVSAEGTVESVAQYRTPRAPRTPYYVTVTFRAPNGSNLIVSQMAGFPEPDNRAGQILPVLLDPADPTRAYFGGVLELWLGPLLWLLVAAVFAAALAQIVRASDEARAGAAATGEPRSLSVGLAEGRGFGVLVLATLGYAFAAWLWLVCRLALLALLITLVCSLVIVYPHFKPIQERHWPR